jgi:hypothetical protein
MLHRTGANIAGPEKGLLTFAYHMRVTPFPRITIDECATSSATEELLKLASFQ